MSKFHVDQIEAHLVAQYEDGYRDSSLTDVNNLSRYLAVYGLDLSLGDGPGIQQRLIEVTDGGQDRGIDAIAVDPVANLLVLSQSKWRQDGTGAFDVSEMLRFVEGVRALVGTRNASEPVHASSQLRTAVRTLLTTPSAKIRLVTVTTGSRSLADEVKEPLEALLAEMNDLEGVEPIMEHSHFGQAELFRSLTAGQRPTVSFDVNLMNWGGGKVDPRKIVYGRVSGADIARWFADHGTDLFAENIRVVIPRSEINAGMVGTVKNSPELFGYYNNGIVILANEVNYAPAGMLNHEILNIGLKGASVVNGAQTVSTLGSLLGTEWEQNLSQIFVLTRCIEVPADDVSLARGITRYANTQNEVSSQDFSFLDEQQHRLARELASVGYEYIIRQAEQPSSDDPSSIIFIRDAAVALACSSDDLGLAVTAKREVSRLFAQGGSEYKTLFNPSTEPLRLLRSVMLVRKVDELLDEMASSATGVELGVAVHGRLVLAHYVAAKLGRARLSDPAWRVEDHTGEIREHVTQASEAIATNFPDNAYPGNVFKNRTRTEELMVSAGLRDAR